MSDETELINGPLHGHSRKLPGPLPPERLAPRTDDGYEHWYELLDGRGYYRFSRNVATGAEVELSDGWRAG